MINTQSCYETDFNYLYGDAVANTDNFSLPVVLNFEKSSCWKLNAEVPLYYTVHRRPAVFKSVTQSQMQWFVFPKMSLGLYLATQKIPR